MAGKFKAAKRAVGAAAAFIPVAQRAWDTLNENDRAAKALHTGVDGIRRWAMSRTRTGQLTLTAEAIRQYAQQSHDPRASQWIAKADEIDRLVPVLDRQNGAQRRKTLDQLRRSADQVLDEVAPHTNLTDV